MSIIAKLGERHNLVPQVKHYLERYGYKDPCRCAERGLCFCCAEGLEKLQSVLAIRQTGNLDLASLKAMRKPRCGNPDYRPSAGVMAKVMSGYKWDKAVLTWSMLGYTRDILGKQEVRAFKRALKTWEKALEGKLQFKWFLASGLRKAVEADIVAIFGITTHKAPDPQKKMCPYDFEGELAHAFYPLAQPGYEYLAGNVHMDDTWNWVGQGNKPGAYSALSVLIHELGHSLGLAHDTQNPGAIMYPYYNGAEALVNWDIQAIRELYP